MARRGQSEVQRVERHHHPDHRPDRPNDVEDDHQCDSQSGDALATVNMTGHSHSDGQGCSMRDDSFTPTTTVCWLTSPSSSTGTCCRSRRTCTTQISSSCQAPASPPSGTYCASKCRGRDSNAYGVVGRRGLSSLRLGSSAT